MKKKCCIIGGGISGLTAAYLLAKEENYTVHIVEKNDAVGGLLRSFDYGEFGCFDYGAHNILETDIPEIDDFFLSLLPVEEWQVTTTINGQRRALTGLIHGKNFQQNSPFIDLRNHPKRDKYIADFFQNIENQKNTTNLDVLNSNAEEYSEYLFGKEITKDIITPALYKLFNTEPRELNSMVMHLVQLSRIGLFEEIIMKELIETNNISKRLSYPEQRDLPTKHLTHLKAYYPKNYGMYRVINALENKLKNMGVIFHKNSNIEKVIMNEDRIESVIKDGELFELDYMINSVGLAPLSSWLNVDCSEYSFDSHPKTVMTNILIDKPLNCGEISFIYSYDNNTKIFRVDNYINYSSGAKRKGYYPITVESIEFGEIDEDLLQKKIIQELRDNKILEADCNVKFVKTEILESGFPLLSQNNVSIVNDIREKIENKNITNLTNIGILSKKGLFFENDVIKETYKDIKEIINDK